jgi:Tol biopolymer transport system component
MRFTLSAAFLLLILLTLPVVAEQAFTLKAVQPMAPSVGDILSATWSPDGNMLALTHAKHAGIYLVDPQSGPIETVTDEAQAGYRFAWSPDGRYIAYKALVDAGLMTKTVKLADLETGQIRQLSGLSTDVVLPTWLPDGRIGFAYQGDFLIMDLSGRILETIPDIASNVTTVSSDGRWILYNDGQDRLWAYHLATGEQFQATPDGRRFFNPVWSPTEPVVLINELGGPFYLLNIADGHMVELDDGNHYAWSPDGRQIIYDVTEDDGHYITAADLYIINPDGTGRTALTNTEARLEMYPSWSVADRIAFSEPDGNAFVAQLAAQ